jgi:hypothetical protein
MRDYRVVGIPLSAVTPQPVELIAAGVPIGAAAVVRMPAAAGDTVDLHFGPGGDPIPLIAALQSLSSAEPQKEGIFYTVRAVTAGQEMKILFGLGADETLEVLREIRDELSAIRKAFTGKDY